GVGIAADELERIFQAFVQAETGHTRRAGGTGLGLTIRQRLARLQGGDLTVRSEPGRGSCFSLWLPASAQERVTRAETPAEPGPSRDLSPFAALGQAMLESIKRLEEELVWRL